MLSNQLPGTCPDCVLFLVSKDVKQVTVLLSMSGWSNQKQLNLMINNYIEIIMINQKQTKNERILHDADLVVLS